MKWVWLWLSLKVMAMWRYLLTLRDAWGARLIFGLGVLGLMVVVLLIISWVDVRVEAVPSTPLRHQIKSAVVKKDSLRGKLKNISDEKNRAIGGIDGLSDEQLRDSLEKMFGK